MKSKKPRAQNRTAARLMLATGLCHFVVQRHLRRGTTPSNPLVRAAWARELSAIQQETAL